MNLDLLAVSVGMPAPLGRWQGEPIMSGIKKTPLASPSVVVGVTNIAGDGQADLTVHGGEDKAIYVYSADHWPWWQSEAKFTAAVASFGENLTLKGGDEHTVRIGDRFAWGSLLLEVSQPRAPCFKFALLTGREDLGTRMTVSGRTGWYCRVLEPGEAPTSGALVRTRTHEAMPTVHEAFTAVYHPRVMSDVIDKVRTAPALSAAWRNGVLKRLRAAGRRHD
jgi:MOSC domain-containing protein YiiM